jgi:hypothetical protein
MLRIQKCHHLIISLKNKEDASRGITDELSDVEHGEKSCAMLELGSTSLAEISSSVFQPRYM